MLNIALPKGRLGERVYTMFAKAGFEIENVHETSAGCVIGTHCGPRTIGILYIKEK